MIYETLTIDTCTSNLLDRYCDVREGVELTLHITGDQFSIRSNSPHVAFGTYGEVIKLEVGEHPHIYFNGTDSHSEEYVWFHEFHMDDAGAWEYRHGVASGPQIFTETGTDGWEAVWSGGPPPAEVSVPDYSTTVLLGIGLVSAWIARKFH